MYQEVKNQDDIKQNKTSAQNATGIPSELKQQYENYSGYSFDDVRVHYYSQKPKQLNALAYTKGNHVYIAPKQEKHLGHELSHVVQQKRGQVMPTISLKGEQVNVDEHLEKEADQIFNNVSSASYIEPPILKHTQNSNSQVTVQRLKEPQKEIWLKKLKEEFPDDQVPEVKKNELLKLIDLVKEDKDNIQEVQNNYNIFLFSYYENDFSKPDNQDKKDIKDNLNNYLNLFSDEIYNCNMFDIYMPYIKKIKDILSDLEKDENPNQVTYSDALENNVKSSLNSIKDNLNYENEFTKSIKDKFIIDVEMMNIFKTEEDITMHLQKYYFMNSLYEIDELTKNKEEYIFTKDNLKKINNLSITCEEKKKKVLELQTNIVNNDNTKKILNDISSQETTIREIQTNLKEAEVCNDYPHIYLTNAIEKFISNISFKDIKSYIIKNSNNINKFVSKNMDKNKMEKINTDINTINTGLDLIEAKISDELKSFYTTKLISKITSGLDLNINNVIILAEIYANAKITKKNLNEFLKNVLKIQYSIPHKDFVLSYLDYSESTGNLVVKNFKEKLTKVTNEFLKDVHTTLYFENKNVQRSTDNNNVYNQVLGNNGVTCFHVSTNEYMNQKAAHIYRNGIQLNFVEDLINVKFEKETNESLKEILGNILSCDNVLQESKIRVINENHFRGFKTGIILEKLKKI